MRARGVRREEVEQHLSQAVPRPWPSELFSKVRRSFQAELRRRLRPVAEAELQERMRDKLRRWRLPGLPGQRARLALERLRAMARVAQPRVQAATLKSLWNGLVTARRMQQAPRRCHFGCAHGADELEHYVRCSVLRRVAARRLQVHLSPGDFFEHMMLVAAPTHTNAAQAPVWRRIGMLHYAIHRTVNAARHHPSWRPGSMAEHALEQALIEARGPGTSAP